MEVLQVDRQGQLGRMLEQREPAALLAAILEGRVEQQQVGGREVPLEQEEVQVLQGVRGKVVQRAEPVGPQPNAKQKRIAQDRTPNVALARVIAVPVVSSTP